MLLDGVREDPNRPLRLLADAIDFVRQIEAGPIVKQGESASTALKIG